jgi:hypothetical protein
MWDMRGRVFWFAAVRIRLSTLLFALMILYAVLMNLASMARGQSGAPTVEEFARNDSLRNGTVIACREDPAWAKDAPQCINAGAAQLRVLEREGMSRLGLLANTPPNNPKYWLLVDPREHWRRLHLCKTMTTEQRFFSNCAAAESAGRRT